MFDPPLGGQHFAIQLILKKFQNIQNVHTYIPIDAKFYADFRNVYFCYESGFRPSLRGKLLKKKP